MAKFYCLTCEELICHICIVLEHRDTNEHDLVDVAEACKQRKDAVRNFLPTVAEVRNKFNRSERQAEKTQENMAANIDLVKEQLEKESAAIINMVEEEKKKLSSQLDVIKHNRRQAIADMKVLAANVGKQTQHAYDLSKTAIEEATDGDFLSLYPILIGKLQQLCHEVPGDIDQKLEYVDFTGPASKHHIDLGTVVEKLGWQMCGEFGREGVADGEFKLAQGIITCPDNMVVTDSGNARVSIFNARGEFKGLLKPQDGKPESNFRRPADIARTSNDHYVVVDQSRYVKVFDSEGHFIRGFATLQAGEDPNQKVCPVSVAVDPQDRIFVADYIRRLLTIHQHDGNLIKKVPLDVKPWILTINSKQQILVSDYAAGKVECIDLNGRNLFTIDTLIDGIQGKAAGVCCDSNDDIYVAIHPGTYGSSPVHQYSSTGQFVNVIAKGLYNPQCMSFTVDGRLAVADTISVKMFKLKSI
ncbi:LOW QUALITY PROTEIN: E3 ubiquitin-protein ligase TRIM32-like [Amphiura filiformis]|uniref:LOW QUALITY PROTEIN: E3 ubiquitin-protein ligase TRIM32-like n=1 Tax=Amphiura filiformis TaxID=82378 RepID=UPI003B216928